MSVLVCFDEVSREVGTVAELDEVLDGLAVGDQPALVELRGGAVAMNLGVGLQNAAVVLFRDADGRPWCARSRRDSSITTKTELAFAKDGTVYRFDANAAVHPSVMREAARDFVSTPGARPTVLDWLPEGGAATADGGDSGS